ncbi:MAG: hypothetical protein JWP82_1370 [Humibacillus sp.]|nr:hypothetical protein [Humibacillus sp.]
MAAFHVHLDPDLSAAETWRRVLDLRSHSVVIPLTTVRGTELAATDLVPGSRFTARTAVGPVGFDDVMVIDEITQPADGAGARALIRKEGRVIRGDIELRVTPRGPGSSTLDWSQRISVRGVPRALGPVVALVARAAYGRTIRQLLQRA